MRNALLYRTKGLGGLYPTLYDNPPPAPTKGQQLTKGDAKLPGSEFRIQMSNRDTPTLSPEPRKQSNPKLDSASPMQYRGLNN